MGFFGNGAADSSNPGELSPLSKERISQILTEMDVTHSTDNDGDLVAGFEDAGVFFFVTPGKRGEILCVRGIWAGVLPPEKYGEVSEFCQDWNRQTLFPKAYADLVTYEDDRASETRVQVELTMDYEHGLSDSQLKNHLNISISTAISCYNKLGEEFPEFVMP